MGEALGHYMWEAICPCFFPQRDSAIFRACESNNSIEAVREILAKDPTAVEGRRNDDKASPLHVAVMLQDADLVRLLLNNGAVVDARDAQGRTGLHVASLNGNITIASLLLDKYEADGKNSIDSPTEAGQTPLYLACWRGHLELAQRLHASGSSTMRVDNEGKTMLQRAKDWNQTRVVEWLEQERERTLTPPKRTVLPAATL